MNVRRIDTLDGFEALEPVWQGVATESGQTSPFLSHEWFGCCWRAAGGGRSPEVLLIQDSVGPVALVPLIHWEGKLHGLRARFVGMLNSPDTAFADWLIVGRPEPVIEAVMAHLVARQDWDVLALNGLPAASLTLKALQAWLPGRYRWHRIPSLHSPYLNLALLEYHRDMGGILGRDQPALQEDCAKYEEPPRQGRDGVDRGASQRRSRLACLRGSSRGLPMQLEGRAKSRDRHHARNAQVLS